MRFLKVCLFFLILLAGENSFATGPGANYGCLVYDNNKIYTNWYKNDYAPGNPYWGPFDYYNTGGVIYNVNYDTTYPTCYRCVNPNSQFNKTGGACFVKLTGNNFAQGALGQVHSLPGMNVPLDDYTWVLLVLIGTIGVVLISRKEVLG